MMAGRIDTVAPSKLGRHHGARSRPWITGPAGVLIPHPADAYRFNQDGPGLYAIVGAAWAAYLDAELSPAWRIGVATLLEQDVAARFPAADMAVLERYRFAQERRPAIFGSGWGTWGRFVLAPRVLPIGREIFPEDPESGPLGARLPTVPTDARPFFVRARELVREKANDFDPATSWVSVFKAREKRAPTWAEIEEAFPRIGAWMAEQRGGAGA